ncbi:bifunctional folylpolyglutamate synthase/dihydrofolate synthase [Helicobacter sp. T3_23-1059]
MEDLDTFLTKKGAEYAPFDTQRVHRIYALLEPHLEKLYRQSRESKQNSPFIIHILGTNGKGSTGRFITLGLAQNGYKVLHFTSPHLFDFNERFYMANMQSCADLVDCVDYGAKSSAKAKITDCRTQDSNRHRITTHSELENAHLWLQRFPIVRESSYFEYATFLALYLAKDCDFFVCEAGLGGEFDSTSVLNADLSIFTPISFDHQDMLGSSIKAIATTKLKAMSKRVILAPQAYKEVQQIAQKIATQKGATLLCVENVDTIAKSSVENHSKNTLDFAKDSAKKIALPPHFSHYAQNLAPFLQQNLFVAYKALKSIGISVDFDTLGKFDLPFRAQYITPNILVDVGHNAHCAHSILQIVKQKRVILVYNTFFDKDAKTILGILKPVIDRLLILEVRHSRILPKDKLIEILQNLGIKYADFVESDFIQNIEKIKENPNMLCVVFGSFSVVKEFMEFYNVAR